MNMNLLGNLVNKQSFLYRYFPFALLAISFFFLIFQYDLTWFNTHMARDFFRADELFNPTFTHWLGPELGWDYKRLPGPFYYIFLSFLLVFKSLFAMFFVKALFIVFCIYLLLIELKKRYESLLPTFSLLFLLMPLFIFTSRNFWNPSLVVALNCLMLTCFLAYDRTSYLRYLIYLFFIALLSVQIHFSTLLIYVSIFFTIILNARFNAVTKKINSILFSIFILYLYLWYKLNYVPQFDEQIFNYFGFNRYFVFRFFDFLSLFSLSLFELKDYDLFALLTKGLAEIDLLNYKFFLYFSVIINFFLLLFLLIALVKVKKNWTTQLSVINTLTLIHFGLFILIILLIKNKEHIPYRYGLCLFPLQFLFLSANVPLYLKRKSYYFTFFCFFVFIFYASFNFKMIAAQKILGRSHHTHLDNLELTLRNKMEIYQNHIGEKMSGDPFNNLHGRTINKFRLKEMNWEQNIAYYSIYKLLFNKKVNYTPEIAEQVPEKAFHFQLKNNIELHSSSDSAYKLTELSPTQSLPQELVISYFDSEQNLIFQRTWKNTNLIMPFAFIAPELNFESIRLSFKINKNGVGAVRYLNLLIDDNKEYKFAYPTLHMLQDIKANKNDLLPIVKYKGNFLVQNQYIYKLNNIDYHIEIGLYALKKYTNYSRIDLFITDYLPWQEEL